ncbi:4Fe-4S binding protein [Desulfosediminicola flagellatus]|uniref:4Fe-4S binding protein n=1 Tax=Desulfosediminicola flagellatus TaxID=2569541 RepID=UPI001E60D102|nr:4Fe-4S binding protein [Desulfosediminicola flagellatus]
MQWLTMPLVPLVIVGGYFYPLLGLVIVGMIAVFMNIALFRGRYFCGWFCGLGGVFERILSKVSLNKPMLPLFTKKWFRWLMFGLMMSLLGSRLYMSGSDPELIGSTFRMMWIVSLGFATAFGLILKPRTWCTVCPMGTMQGLISKNTYLLRVDQGKCKECGICKKSCPIETDPGALKAEGQVPSLDCMRCSNCVVNCPTKALSFGSEQKSMKSMKSMSK